MDMHLGIGNYDERHDERCSGAAASHTAAAAASRCDGLSGPVGYNIQRPIRGFLGLEFLSTRQEFGWEERIQNDHFCVD